MQATSQLIQIIKASRNTRQAALIIEQLFDILHAIHQHSTDGRKIGPLFAVGNLQNTAFRRIQQNANLIIGLVAHGCNLCRHLD